MIDLNSITRSVEMENGNSVTFFTGPRWPFWRVKFDKGGMPKELENSMWSTYDQAYRAVKNYLEKRPARNRTTFKEED